MNKLGLETPVISVTNKKGGVGKSTTTSGLASICAHYGARVLTIDLDPQTNITSLFLRNKTHKTIGELILSNQDTLDYDFVKSHIIKTEYENIDIIPGNEELDEIGDKILLGNAWLTPNGKIEMKSSALQLITKSLDLIKKDYDLILIDNTPYFNTISKNALTASNGVLIPVQTDGFSYDGLGKLLKKIYDIKGLNKSLDIIGVFFNNVNNRTTLYSQLNEYFKKDLGDTFLKTFIRQDNQVKESNTAFTPLFNYCSKDSNAVFDFMHLIEELHLLDEKKHSSLQKDLRAKEKEIEKKLKQKKLKK